MAIDTSFHRLISNASNKANSPNFAEKIVYGRVLDVILDNSYPNYNDLGGIEALYSIKYEIYNENSTGNSENAIGFAQPFDISTNRIPVIDEIVELIDAPSYSLDVKDYPKKVYYKSITNVWNSSHHNALPNVSQNKTEVQLGQGTVELNNVQLTQPFPGDTLIQGRLGQFIRFSGYKHKLNVLTDDSNNGSPFTIISNTSPKTDSDPFTAKVEDINTEDSIIALASNHKIPIQVQTTLENTYKKDPTIKTKYTPTTPSNYKGPQIVINSSRLVLNAKHDSILLYGSKSVGLSGPSVNIEGKDYVAIQAPKIYLGSGSKSLSLREKNPIVLGNQLEEWASSLIDLLQSIATDFSTATSPAQASLALVKAGNSMLIKLTELSNEINKFKSKKVFTD